LRRRVSQHVQGTEAWCLTVRARRRGAEVSSLIWPIRTAPSVIPARPKVTTSVPPGCGSFGARVPGGWYPPCPAAPRRPQLPHPPAGPLPRQRVPCRFPCSVPPVYPRGVAPGYPRGVLPGSHRGPGHAADRTGSGRCGGVPHRTGTMPHGCGSFGVRPGTGMPSVLAGCPEIAAVTSVPAAAGH